MEGRKGGEGENEEKGGDWLGTGVVMKTIDFKQRQRFGAPSQITGYPARTDRLLPFQAVIEI